MTEKRFQELRNKTPYKNTNRLVMSLVLKGYSVDEAKTEAQKIFDEHNAKFK